MGTLRRGFGRRQREQKETGVEMKVEIEVEMKGSRGVNRVGIELEIEEGGWGMVGGGEGVCQRRGAVRGLMKQREVEMKAIPPMKGELRAIGIGKETKKFVRERGLNDIVYKGSPLQKN